MGKICAVPGCSSGTSRIQNLRKSQGLRQVTLFAVPKNDERRKEWKKALGCDLDTNHFVCEFHFSENDIKKADRTVLVDGTVYEAPLMRPRLERGAIPKSKQQESLNSGSNNNEEGEIVSQNDAVAVEKEQQRDPIIVKETENPPPYELTQPSMEEVKDDVEAITTPFTMNDLKVELSGGLLPESWAWTRNASGVIFTLLNRVDFHPLIHLEVALDLTLQIRTIADTIVQLDDQVTSMNDVLRQLDTLNWALICSGTGMESKSRHPQCTEISYPAKNGELFRRPWRCNSCRSLRKTLQKRDQRRNKLADQQEQAKKTAELTRRKFRRLQQTTKKALADVAELKQTCSKIEKNTLEENISSLPAPQQQAVRACFEAAKVGNKSGRRYTLDWINECVLMRNKNSDLYDYLRDRQFLPLPCRETLSRISNR